MPAHSTIRAIETDQYRLVQYQLPTGEEYFRLHDDSEAPTVIRTVDGSDVSFVAYSTLSSYQETQIPVVFLNRSGLTVVNGKPKNFLLRTELSEHLPLYPLPLLLEEDDPDLVRDYSRQLRAVASQKRLAVLADFQQILGVLNATTTRTTKQASEAIQTADDSLDFLTENLTSLDAEDPRYSELRKTSTEQMSVKLANYNQLMALIDLLAEEKQQLERVAYKLQQKIVPILKIANDLPFIS